jgi:hypothetical protein
MCIYIYIYDTDKYCDPMTNKTATVPTTAKSGHESLKGLEARID